MRALEYIWCLIYFFLNLSYPRVFYLIKYSSSFVCFKLTAMILFTHLHFTPLTIPLNRGICKPPVLISLIITSLLICGFLLDHKKLNKGCCTSCITHPGSYRVEATYRICGSDSVLSTATLLLRDKCLCEYMFKSV